MSTIPPSHRLAGWLLLAAIGCSIASGTGLLWSTLPAGLLFWLAGLLLSARVVGAQRLQAGLMLLVGIGGLAYAFGVGGPLHWARAIASNQALLAMLASVTFLRLISLPRVERDEPDPVGPQALWRTLLGVHLFGSVINLSSVMILGDRQSRQAPMTPLQATVLSRGFSLAAHWSPFFAAMGIALSQAPGSDLITLSLAGLPLAAAGLLLSGWQLSRRDDARSYVGYPMHFGALWIPGLLATLVVGCHQLWPEVPILTFISGLSLAMTLSVLLLREPKAALGDYRRHIETGLPRMSGELLLFLAAGVLAAGIGSAVDASGFALALSHFGATEAGLLLLLMIGLALVGIHPVISIATAHGLLMPLSPDPNLLGITFLMAWAGGVCGSPFSGMHLGMQGRFGINNLGFLRWNGGFVLLMLLLDALLLQLYESLAG